MIDRRNTAQKLLDINTNQKGGRHSSRLVQLEAPFSKCLGTGGIDRVICRLFDGRWPGQIGVSTCQLPELRTYLEWSRERGDFIEAQALSTLSMEVNGSDGYRVLRLGHQ